MHREPFAKIDAVAAAARESRGVRAEALPKLKGLRAFYRTLELTRSRPLARPSRAFCFAKFLLPFPKRLKREHRERRTRHRPGVPENYPYSKKLVTEDCIKPNTTE